MNKINNIANSRSDLSTADLTSNNGTIGTPYKNDNLSDKMDIEKISEFALDSFD